MEGLIERDEDVGAEELEAGAAAAAYRAATRRADDRTEEELARYIEERYRGMAEDAYDDDGGGAGGGGAGGGFGGGGYAGNALAQEALLPTAADPRLWVVQCRAGREREAVMQLLQKSYALAARGAPIAIRSAVCHDHLKGYFYVEADKESHVVDAVRGLRTVFAGKGARLVPLKEMPDAMAVPRGGRGAEVARDAWVRVKTGLYKDDLGRVS